MYVLRCVVRTGSLLILAVLAACGGSGSGSSGGPGGLFLGGFSVSVTVRNEVEPNDSLAAANAYTLPVRTSDTNYVGFGVKGSVDDAIDPADYFVFTPSRAHAFTIELCPVGTGPVPSCGPVRTTELIDTSVAYFEVLDQDGVLLLSSQGDIATGNSQEISLEAGIAYYLGVFAEDTVGEGKDYVIETIERIPLP